MSSRDTLDFLLYDWLKVDQLTARERFADHSRATFDAVLDTCERLARDKFAPFNRLLDTEEPRFENGRVRLPQATHDALHAYAESGIIGASACNCPASSRRPPMPSSRRPASRWAPTGCSRTATPAC